MFKAEAIVQTYNMKNKRDDHVLKTKDPQGYLKQKSLEYHAIPTPGKYAIKPIKRMLNQKDLSLAYSPGVAEPCLAIKADPEVAYKYTNKGSIIACISNGTHIGNLGDIGPLACKPMLEGMSVLIKKFSGVDCVDICIDAPKKEEVLEVVSTLGPSFGGILLEGFKTPDCFEIEQELGQKMNIPVFHDGSHGVPIICLGGLYNALEI